MYGEKNVHAGKHRSVLHNIITKTNRDTNASFNITYKLHIYCTHNFIMVLPCSIFGVLKKRVILNRYCT